MLPVTFVPTNVLPASLVQSNVLHATGGEISDGTCPLTAPHGPGGQTFNGTLLLTVCPGGLDLKRGLMSTVLPAPGGETPDGTAETPRIDPTCRDSRVTGLSPQSRCDALRGLHFAGVGRRCPCGRVRDSRVTGLSPQSRCDAPLVNGNLSGLAGHGTEPAIPLRRPDITHPFGTRGSRA
jgi:hypothetical protein